MHRNTRSSGIEGRRVRRNTRSSGSEGRRVRRNTGVAAARVGGCVRTQE